MQPVLTALKSSNDSPWCAAQEVLALQAQVVLQADGESEVGQYGVTALEVALVAVIVREDADGELVDHVQVREAEVEPVEGRVVPRAYNGVGESRHGRCPEPVVVCDSQVH